MNANFSEAKKKLLESCIRKIAARKKVLDNMEKNKLNYLAEIKNLESIVEKLQTEKRGSKCKD